MGYFLQRIIYVLIVPLFVGFILTSELSRLFLCISEVAVLLTVASPHHELALGVVAVHLLLLRLLFQVLYLLLRQQTLEIGRLIRFLFLIRIVDSRGRDRIVFT